ncbi:unnamed protein product [Echinostoma caproni]|uniref:Ras-related protein RABC2a n=1 Tax=Echinostoma caproni TaxID=27848 RepID=A0A183ALX1_9TREM|nr:unnamed protein product [Echinostoma caproni]
MLLADTFEKDIGSQPEPRTSFSIAADRPRPIILRDSLRDLETRSVALNCVIRRQSIGYGPGHLADQHDLLSSSYNSVKDWLHEIKCYADSRVSRLLVGNKCDLEASRAVPAEMAKTFADECNMLFLETSAKEATNVENAFVKMAEQISASAASMQGLHSATVTVNSTQPVKPSGGCC